MDTRRAALLVDAGVCMRMSGDVDGARTLFERALQMDSENAKAREFLQVSGALAALPPPVRAPAAARAMLGDDWDDVAPQVKVLSRPPQVVSAPPALRPEAPGRPSSRGVQPLTRHPGDVIAAASRPPPLPQRQAEGTSLKSPPPLAQGQRQGHAPLDATTSKASPPLAQPKSALPPATAAAPSPQAPPARPPSRPGRFLQSLRQTQLLDATAPSSEFVLTPGVLPPDHRHHLPPGASVWVADETTVGANAIRPLLKPRPSPPPPSTSGEARRAWAMQPSLVGSGLAHPPGLKRLPRSRQSGAIATRVGTFGPGR